MKLSFIIAALSYDSGIEECVRSIRQAGERNADVGIEIICVFQGIREKRQFPEEACDYLKTYYIEEQGLSRARNHGIRHSAGDFLVFLDDHATVDKSLVKIFASGLEPFPADAYGGKMLDPVTLEPFVSRFNEDSARVLSRADFRFFMGSSHILSRKVIELAGYYDERFGRGSRFLGAEESDLFFRMLNIGLTVRYAPDIIFYHPVFTRLDSPQVHQNSYAMSAMLTKNMLADPVHAPFYMYVCLSIISKSLIRLVQSCFIKRYRDENERFHYAGFVSGTVAGMIGYLLRR